jgi:hypothetical protein
LRGQIPNLIDLYPLAFEIAEHAVLIPSRCASGIDHQLRDCRLSRACQAGDGADEIAIAEKLQNPGTFCS